MPAMRNGNGGRRLPELRVSGHSEQPRYTQTNRAPEKKTAMRKLSDYLSCLLRYHA